VRRENISYEKNYLYRFWAIGVFLYHQFGSRLSAGQKIGYAYGRCALRAPDFRLAGQKVAWLWENPFEIVGENRGFLEMSCIYEKVRTFFRDKYRNDRGTNR